MGRGMCKIWEEESVVGLLISNGIVQEVDLTLTYSMLWVKMRHKKYNETRQIPQTNRLTRTYILQLLNAIFFITLHNASLICWMLGPNM